MIRMSFLRLEAAFLVTVLSGPTLAPLVRFQSGSDWPLFRGDPALTGTAAGELPGKPEERWSFQAAKGIVSSPVVADGRVYFGCDDGQVHCLESSSGKLLWAHPTGDVIEAPPLVSEGLVFVGSSDFFFYALDARTGELRWKHETGDKILGGANTVRVGDETRVVVGSYDSSLYCFAAASGEQRWSYGTGNYVNGTPAVLEDRVVFGGCDTFVHVVSASTGQALAKIALGQDANVAGSAALRDGRAYLGHYGNAFVCVDLARQELLWSYPDPKHPFFSSPAVSGERVVFGGRDKHLHCARAEDGEPLWKFPARRKVDGSPVIVGDEVVFGSGDGRLVVLDLAEGRERWSVDLGAEIASSPAVAGGWIFVTALDGRVFAFGPPREKDTGEEQG